MLGWLQRLLGAKANPTRPVATENVTLSVQRTLGSILEPGRPLWTGPSDTELIARALTIADRTHPGALPFYAALYSDVSFRSYRDLLRAGELLTAGEKKAFGMKIRAHVGRAFFETLNERGKRDPREAADRIAGAINGGMRSRFDLASAEAIQPGSAVRFLPSNMAAGPCGAARSAPRAVRARDASLLPLDGCGHPDQCACRYVLEIKPS